MDYTLIWAWVISCCSNYKFEILRIRDARIFVYVCVRVLCVYICVCDVFFSCFLHGLIYYLMMKSPAISKTAVSVGENTTEKPVSRFLPVSRLLPDEAIIHSSTRNKERKKKERINSRKSTTILTYIEHK